jgi:chromosome segregation ATPase
MKHDECIETLAELNEPDLLEWAAEDGDAAAALDRLETDLAKLSDEYERLNTLKRSSADPFATWQPDSSRLEFLRENLPAPKSKINSLRDRLKVADAAAARERLAMEAAESRLHDLEARSTATRARAEKMRDELDAAREQAATAEADAARKYAVAISSGDSGAGKSALAGLQKA